MGLSNFVFDKIYEINWPWTNRLFGPTQKADGEWRLKTNEELENAIRYENIVRHIQSKRLSWLRHVERMTNERVPKIIYKWKPYATRPKGRPRLRWEDDVRNDLGSMGVKNWKQKVQERKQWKEIIEQAKTHKRVVELKKWQMYKFQRWLHGGLVCTICYNVPCIHQIQKKVLY